METLNYIISKFGLQEDDKRITDLDITRKDIAQLFSELGFKTGAEIGVEKGVYSEVLAKANPQLLLYCIDPWKVYEKYSDFKNQGQLNTNYKIAQKRLSPYNCKIIRKSTTGALPQFKMSSLDFVYIDGNHTYEYVWEDLAGWSEKVRPGGIISGHDYRARRKEHVGVGEAVDKYTQERSVRLFTATKGGESSWFFVNM